MFYNLYPTKPPPLLSLHQLRFLQQSKLEIDTPLLLPPYGATPIS